MTARTETPGPVAAKLAWPCTDDVVLRDATIEAYAASLPRRLTLVLAPAGYGKSCVTAELLQRMPHAGAWYNLDVLDRDPAVLLAGITHALRTLLPDFGGVLLERLRAAAQIPIPLAELAAAFTRECAARCTADTYLVLDDYHETVEADDLNHTLDHLLTYAPPKLHFILLSRYEPAFSTAKLKLEGQLGIVGSDLLRLESAQAGAMLERRTGRTWGAGGLERLTDLTEGWPASVVLAGMALGWLDFDSLESALADPRLKGDMYSYLAEQVYARESASTRLFLKRTCCLETITPALARRLTDPKHADRHLEHLARNRVFTFSAEQEGAYRYHTLFREFLRLKCLSESGHVAFHALQCETAEALEEAGDTEMAVELLLSANEPLRALEAVARAGEPGLEKSPSRRLQDWLERLPTHVRASEPWANLLTAQLLMRSGRFDSALARIDRAITGIDDELSFYHALSMKECTFFWQGEIEKAATTCHEALRHAQNDQQRIHSLISLGAAALEMRDWTGADEAYSEAECLLTGMDSSEALRLGILRSLSTYYTGDFRAALAQAAVLNEAGAPAGMLISLRSTRGIIDMTLGYLASARELLELALQTAQAHGEELQCCLIRDSLGVCLSCEGQLGRGLQEIQSACNAPATRADPSMFALTLSHIGTVLRRQGDMAAALPYYRSASVAVTRKRDPYAFLNCLVNVTFAEASLGEHVGCSLASLASQAAEAGLQFVELKATFLQAALAHGNSDTDGAMLTLADCIPRQLRLGHLNFLAQELTLDLGLLLAYLSAAPWDTPREAVLRCVAGHWRGPSVLADIVAGGTTGVASRILAFALEELAGDAQREVLRAARVCEDKTLRRRARIFLTSVESRAANPASPLPQLTPRELHVLSLAAAGLDNKAIAADLFISTTTVKTHINRIFMKLGVSSRVQAILAYQTATPAAGTRRSDSRASAAHPDGPHDPPGV